MSDSLRELIAQFHRDSCYPEAMDHELDAIVAALSAPQADVEAALTCDFAQVLPGGKLDDSSYSKIEDALDRIDAPAQDANGKWLSLHERIAAIPAPPSQPQADAAAVAYVPISQAPSSAGEPLWHETFAAKWRDKGTWRGFALQALYTAPPSQSAEMRKALRDVIDNGLIYWEPNTKRGHVAKALMIARCEKLLALSRAGDGKESEGGEDPFVHGAEDEAYALGRHDGYESAIQDLDLATGGDGEFKGSAIPGETVDVMAMKARIIARFADEGKESEGGLNRQARNPAGLPDSSGDLASAGGIAGVDVTDHRRQVGSDAPSDPTPPDRREAIELERLRSVASAAQGLLNADTYVSDVPREQAVSLATMKLAQALGTWQLHHGACKARAETAERKLAEARAALKAFLPDPTMMDILWGDMDDEATGTHTIKLKHFRAARAVIEKE